MSGLMFIPNAKVDILSKSGGGSYTGGATGFKNLWHATITPIDALPGYGYGASAPHATILCDYGKRKVWCVQQTPLNTSARALENRPGGVQTNRDNVLQWELAGYLDDKYGAHQNLLRMPDWYWDQVAAIMKPICMSYGVPNRATPDWTTAGRLSYSAWDNFAGHIPHANAAEQNHWDLPLTQKTVRYVLSKIYNGKLPVVDPPKPGPVSTFSNFPLQPGHYFGRTSSDKYCHSGYYSIIDRNYIRIWQARMRSKWSSKVDVDGFFGPYSEAVAKSFQRLKNLTQDGRVGKQTWSAAFSI